METQMPLYIWDINYSVNNEELDNHHKKLFDIFNKLYDNSLDKDNRITLGPIVEELVSYFNYHLVAEEQYMRSIGYKEINDHISEHKIYLDRIGKLKQKKHILDIVVSDEFILHLGKWIVDHIIELDGKYAV
jgi:hemerythrin